jgi:hypothetical protein
MVQQVSDTASNRRDQIANFAELLKKASARQRVFNAVYYGKKRFKTVEDVASATGFNTKRVTEIAKPLAEGEKLFEQGRERINGRTHTVYRKIHFVERNKRKILKLANNKKALDSFHTKTNPKGKSTQKIVLRVPIKIKIKTKFIGIEAVDQFAKTKKIRANMIPERLSPERLPEQRVKEGLVKLLGETEVPKDWGGESNDIFTTRVRLNGERRRAAFALKGPAKKGPLVPAMMGKNGDQIQRLFKSPADVFFVQYEGEIKQSIVELMEELAKAKALLGQDVFYGVIDKDDTCRLRLAYPKAFRGRA